MKKKLILLLILLLMITLSCTTEEENDPIPGVDGTAGGDQDSVVKNPDSDTIKNDTEPAQNPDTDLTCNPGDAIRCSDTEIKDLIKCNSEGTGEVVVECQGNMICIDKRCEEPLCEPGARTCDESNPNAIFTCNSTGSGVLPDPVLECDKSSGTECSNGECISLCLKAAANKNYEGCEYFPVKLRYGLIWDGYFDEYRPDGYKYSTINIDGVDEQTGESYHNFSLVISNSSKLYAASVDVTFSDQSIDTGGNFCTEDGNGDMSCSSVSSLLGLTIPAGKIAVVQTPSGDSVLTDTGTSYRSYRLKSSIPVAVYQFNPLNSTVGMYGTKDATILLPSSALYSEYTVLSMPHGGRVDYPPSFGLEDENVAQYKPAYVAIVGTSAMNVNLVITPPPGVEIGGPHLDTKILHPGTALASATNTNPLEITLQRNMVINILTKKVGDDLTGTTIKCKDTASNCDSFAVYTGHTGLEVPATIRAQDHVEHQLFPDQTWGTNFYVVKTDQRGYEKDYLRIVAKEAGTEITFSKAIDRDDGYPTVTPVTTLTLGKGEYKSFLFDGGLNIKSSKPILIGQFLSGGEMVGKDAPVIECEKDEDCTDPYFVTCSIPDGQTKGTCKNPRSYGDPSLMLIPPQVQFRTAYNFVTPGGYNENFANIVMQKNAVAKVNGVEVTEMVDIGNTGFVYAIYPLGKDFKRHTLECSSNCGLTLYGWSNSVSYAYTGGMNLKEMH